MGFFDFFRRKPAAAPIPEAAPDTATLRPGTNTGVVEVPPKPDSWIRGGETGVQKIVLEADGQYDIYLPDEEAQSFYTPARFDTQSCVSFSGENCIELLINRLRSKKLLSKKQEDFLVNDGYINPQTGKLNVSDRFIAKMSGTTQQGNSLEAVANAMRNFGLVPESMWPMPDWDKLKGKSQDEVWAIYMAEIPESVKAQGRKWKEYFDINHEWVILGQSPSDEQVADILKYGPFQIAASVCSPWNSNEADPPIKACGCGSGHATMIYGLRSKDQARKLFDHYRSFKKLLDRGYCIPWGVQFFVKEHVPAVSFPIQKTFTIQLRYGMPDNAEVNALQKALQDLGFMARGVFGPFGPQTRAALGKFQASKGISDPDGPGTNFGPQTRAAMNAALLALTK